MKATTESTKVIIGGVKGRHAMPVTDFIFNDAIVDPTDVEAIRQHVEKVLTKKISIGAGSGAGLNQESYEDVLVRRGNKRLILYVTGLTIVTTEVIRFCAINGVALTLKHFNSASGDYFDEVIF